MHNELIFIVSALFDVLFVSLSFRLGRTWLTATVFINLILINIWGAKIIAIFGITTNVGNVFYASVFFATYLLIEHYGKEAAYRVVWVGFLVVGCFIVLSQLAARYVGAPQSNVFNDASSIFFDFSPRLGLASLLGYLISQSLNIGIYSAIKRKTGDRMLWLRANGASIFAQATDSVVFFTTAFFGILSTSEIVGAILIGWMLKVGVGIAATPFLYLAQSMKPHDLS